MAITLLRNSSCLSPTSCLTEPPKCNVRLQFPPSDSVRCTLPSAMRDFRCTPQAEFWVVPDRTKDRRESFRALEIKILPPSTIKLEEETHKKVQGTVQRAPTLPQRQSFGGGREGTLPPAVLCLATLRNTLEIPSYYNNHGCEGWLCSDSFCPVTMEKYGRSVPL